MVDKGHRLNSLTSILRGFSNQIEAMKVDIMNIQLFGKALLVLPYAFQNSRKLNHLIILPHCK